MNADPINLFASSQQPAAGSDYPRRHVQMTSDISAGESGR